MAQITLSRPKRSQPKARVAQITGPDPTYWLARVISVPANLEATSTDLLLKIRTYLFDKPALYFRR
jgi:hypothetical protein